MEKDIIIIGGGPAGLSTALHLHQFAPHLVPRILVLEKARYPRQKLCAGGLVADAEILLQRLNLNVGEIAHTDGSAAHFDFEGRGLTIRLPGTHTLRVIRRDEFDAWLAENARNRGVEIREGVEVKDLVFEQEYVRVETSAGDFNARLVIGADGSKGFTRRFITSNSNTRTARVLELLAQPNNNPRHAESEAYFDFLPVPRQIGGYTWDFPTRVNGKPMRCWGIYDMNSEPGTQKTGLKELLAEDMARCGYSLADFDLKGHPIRWFSPETRMARPRLLLAGDAAGADPLFGEGISMALGYGLLAAKEVELAFRKNNFTLEGYQNRVLLSPLGQTLLVRWGIAEIIYHLNWKWLQALLWRVLKPFVMAVAWFLVLNWGKRLK